VEELDMKRVGTIYTYTVIHSAAEEFKDRTPYAVALVDEEGQARVASYLEGYDVSKNIRIGMEVEYVHDDAAGNPVFKVI
jgi:uncharacterized OB-fold protein